MESCIAHNEIKCRKCYGAEAKRRYELLRQHKAVFGVFEPRADGCYSYRDAIKTCHSMAAAEKYAAENGLVACFIYISQAQ